MLFQSKLLLNSFRSFQLKDFLNRDLSSGGYNPFSIANAVEHFIETNSSEKVAAHEKIIKEAILLLTPDKPLFKKHY
jgi:hypothetical protein